MDPLGNTGPTGSRELSPTLCPRCHNTSEDGVNHGGFGSKAEGGENEGVIITIVRKLALTSRIDPCKSVEESLLNRVFKGKGQKNE